LTGRFFSVLIAIILTTALPPAAAFGQAPTLCHITDTVYRADGTPAQGTALISWPAFTTAAGQAVTPGSVAVTLDAGGGFNASLAPNTPANAVQISAPSRGAAFTAIVREVDVQVISLCEDRSQYLLRFSNDAAELLAFKFETMTLPEPLTAIFTTTVPSSSLYLPPLTAAQVTNVIATEITVDAGIAPP